MFTMLFIGTLFTLFTFYCIWAEIDGAPFVFMFWIFLTMLFVLVLAAWGKTPIKFIKYWRLTKFLSWV